MKASWKFLFATSRDELLGPEEEEEAIEGGREGGGSKRLFRRDVSTF